MRSTVWSRRCGCRHRRAGAITEYRMDLAAFEHDRKFVIEALRRGEIDYLENVSEAAEADFFRHLLGRDVLERLAEHYPTPRKKEEVPIWLYIASQIPKGRTSVQFGPATGGLRQPQTTRRQL